jgi:plastocyanin
MRIGSSILTLFVASVALAAVACSSGSDKSTAAAPAAPVTNPVDPATAGSVTGKITFMGTAPAQEPIKMSSDPRCMNPDAKTEAVMVGAGGSLQNVFVYVKDGLGNLKFPVPTTPLVLDQKGCQYRPHVFGVQVGQPIEILNSDMTLHNIHAWAQTNQEFNLGQSIQGMKDTHVFTTQEVMVPFRCDVHKWMNSFVGVVAHPFFAVTAADGTFELKGLPPGTYTIEAWQEKLGTKTATVTIGAKESKDVPFTFSS